MSCDGCRRIGEYAEIIVNSGPKYKAEYASSIRGHISSALNTECFKTRNTARSGQPSPGSKPPEYLITSIINLICYDNWVKPDGGNVLKSADMTVNLYYNGKAGRELVQSWRVDKPERDYGDLLPESLPDEATGYNHVKNRMCVNRGSILRTFLNTATLSTDMSFSSQC